MISTPREALSGGGLGEISKLDRTYQPSNHLASFDDVFLDALRLFSPHR
jgi:hypothetical protein